MPDRDYAQVRYAPIRFCRTGAFQSCRDVLRIAPDQPHILPETPFLLFNIKNTGELVFTALFWISYMVYEIK